MKQTNPTASTAVAVTGLACGTAWLAYRFWGRSARCPYAEISDDPVKQGFSMKKVPENLDVIVIGSGMGGLATAAILAKEGKKVLVLEQHDIAGGNLHTFTEEGYEFDTGLHYIGGKIGQKGAPARKLLDYLTDGKVEWEPMDDAYDVAISGNEEFRFYSGWTKLKQHLKASFPEDTEAIDKYFDTVHHVAEVLFPIHFVFKMLPESMFHILMRVFDRQMGIFQKTTKEVLQSITSNAKLRGVLSYHYGDYGEAPERGSFLMNAQIANHYRAGAYYPIGGPLKIAESIVQVIEKWGGKVLVRGRVDTIMVDGKNCAYGVVVKGKQILAKTVVSSVGAPATMTKLIPESHRSLVSRQIDAMKDASVASNVSLMTMFVGIKDVEGSLKLPKCNYWLHPSWDHDKNMAEYKKDQTKVPAFFISFSSAKDPTYASRNPGKQVALVIGPCCYDDVEQFKDDRVKRRSKEYISMKERWQEIFMKVLLDRFPELRSKVDFVDFGTAVTNDFYLGTHRGAVYGLAHTPERMNQSWLRPKTPITNLYLTGQDVLSCGVVGALVGGYFCAYNVSPRSLLHTLSFWV